MAFYETPRFPDDIAYGSSGGPEFRTFVFEGQSGIEQRYSTWARHRGRYDVSYGIRDQADMDTVRAFFYNMAGQAHGFRFKDWSDYTLTQEPIGTGDAATTEFGIIKTYTSGAQTYVRRIFKPIAAGLIVRVNGVVQTLTTDYSVDTTTGIITFVVAPGAALSIDVTCEFDVPVRFETDTMTASHDGFTTESWNSIPLVELIIEDTI